MRRKKPTNQRKGVGLVTQHAPTSTASEQFRTLRTNIQFAVAGGKLKSIVLTSSSPSEGKSTIAANLAVIFANTGLNVLLVDADMRKPTAHRTFSIVNSQGLSTLIGDVKTEVKEVISESTIPHLSVLTSGPKPPNPAELLGSPRMQTILETMETLFDLVIFDMPPVVTVTDAQIMATKVDGTLLVARQKITEKAALTKAVDLLHMVQANVLGVVLNGVEYGKNGSYYYAYEYK